MLTFYQNDVNISLAHVLNNMRVDGQKSYWQAGAKDGRLFIFFGERVCRPVGSDDVATKASGSVRLSSCRLCIGLLYCSLLHGFRVCVVTRTPLRNIPHMGGPLLLLLASASLFQQCHRRGLHSINPQAGRSAWGVPVRPRSSFISGIHVWLPCVSVRRRNA